MKKDHSEKKKEREVKFDKDKRIPVTEWKLIAQAATKVSGPKRCHYFNSSMGCALADKCRFKHACMSCAQWSATIERYLQIQPRSVLEA